MKIPALSFQPIDWAKIEAVRHYGETGYCDWKTFNNADLRVRIVQYSPGYRADHWCDRGHVVYVLEGEVTIELQDGREFHLTPGMSYEVSDFGDAAHRAYTQKGAKSFIVD